MQSQIEAQNNRMKVQDSINEIEESQPEETSGGMRKYARGGIALTISSVPQDERSRSGSKPRFPYMDQEPFQSGGTYQSKEKLTRQKESFSQSFSRPSTANKRLPRELSRVESTIKHKLEQDKRMYFERQRQQ